MQHITYFPLKKNYKAKPHPTESAPPQASHRPPTRPQPQRQHRQEPQKTENPLKTKKYRSIL